MDCWLCSLLFVSILTWGILTLLISFSLQSLKLQGLQGPLNLASDVNDPLRYYVPLACRGSAGSLVNLDSSVVILSVIRFCIISYGSQKSVRRRVILPVFMPVQSKKRGTVLFLQVSSACEYKQVPVKKQKQKQKTLFFGSFIYLLMQYLKLLKHIFARALGFLTFSFWSATSQRRAPWLQPAPDGGMRGLAVPPGPRGCPSWVSLHLPGGTGPFSGFCYSKWTLLLSLSNDSH